ncbi:PREDICTED: cell growth-regulating nucleolar protein [Chrysochloris asiatica]|uniref:Cell growth-regulating nucleolar protein n=1 Tax=Chrysochloris asiatica TaxID=185453 RepID=A0A9B0U5D8_CHRAS|nr:PREDICTED: cell growth-regulating nucleolar protein [Chrysochloris asiatica]
MVFFTCNACGESVKKVQVEKHVAVCRNCECLSCIDCGKDFWGDDYRNHVKCISEDQKYGGRGYEGKTHKGDIKQQAWIQKINELIKRPNVSPKVRHLLEQISAFDNIPRKKAKFQNWMKNSLKIHSESVLEQVWELFSEASRNEPASEEPEKQPLNTVPQPHKDVSARPPTCPTHEGPAKQAEVRKNKRERKEERQKNRKKEKKELKLENTESRKAKKCKKALEAAGAESNGTAKRKGQKRAKGKGPTEGTVNGDGALREDFAEEEPQAGTRKRKHSEGEADSTKKKLKLPAGDSEGGMPSPDCDSALKGKFNWKGTIKAVLKQAPDNEIAVKKLKKKVLAQYYAVTHGRPRPEEELLVIFNKKISKNPAFRLLKDKVKLLK